MTVAEEEHIVIPVKISKPVYELAQSIAKNISELPDEFVTMVLLDTLRELEKKLPPSLPAPPEAEGFAGLEVEPEERRMVPVSVKFPRTLYAWMQQACRDYGITHSMLIRQAVVRYLLQLYSPK